MKKVYFLFIVLLFFLVGCKNFEFDIKKYQLEDKNIYYPQIINYKGELIQEYINQDLINLVKTFENYENIEINYEVKKVNNELLSVLFKGNLVFEGKDKEFLKSINIDMKNGANLRFENYFGYDSSIIDVIATQVFNKYNESLSFESISFYFEKDKIIFFYYPLDDSVENPRFIEFDFEDVKDYINLNIEGPVS